MANHDIIVAGASVGGIETLSSLLQQLPADLPAAVFIVQHLSPHIPSVLAEILDRAAALPVTMAQDNMPFEHGHVYVAPPDRHLLVKEGFVRVATGPRENRSRPAIDPLFRSAAAVYGPRVVGIVLSGSLDDGSAGLLAIRRCNGVTVVQAPADAIHPEMPENALASLNVDHCLPLAEMGELLVQLACAPAKTRVPVSEDILLEIRIAENITSDVPSESKIGHLTALACPECKGPLWEIEDGSVGRYRCSVGHAFTQRALLVEQNETIERTLWEALRLFEEKAKIHRSLARDGYQRQRAITAHNYEERAEQAHRHAAELRKLLLSSS